MQRRQLRIGDALLILARIQTIPVIAAAPGTIFALQLLVHGALKAVIDRIEERTVAGMKLIASADGQPFTLAMLRGAFDRARVAAARAHPNLAQDIREYQFRDLRAKAGTDTEEGSGIAAAQAQLGHSTPMMTAQYVRHRRGKLVKPTK